MNNKLTNNLWQYILSEKSEAWNSKEQLDLLQVKYNLYILHKIYIHSKAEYEHIYIYTHTKIKQLIEQV